MSGLVLEAKRTAVGCALLLRDGDSDSAQTAVEVFVRDALREGLTPCDAFFLLAQVSLSLVASRDDDEGGLQWLASRLAVEA